jgi:predicted AAA+ superfamily ATPase
MNSELVRYPRLLKLQLPKRQSAFLWGARKTGKSTFLLKNFPNAVIYDLLKTDVFFRLVKSPHILREEILALPEAALNSPIILDEVQKIPALLDEVHWLIENTKAQFILCGSSARKLKRTGANLLGGRAWRYSFYPLVYPEIPDFDLLHALNAGLLPSHYLSPNANRSLKAYIQDYLTHEILKEGLIRNLPAFARFLEDLGFTQGQLINYSNIARETGIDSKTVKEYYQILVDTWLGYFIFPYHRKVNRNVIASTPKFYLFDVGVFNSLCKRHISELKGFEAGQAFEHYIFMELKAYQGLTEKDFDITYWRTKTGLEVDFILGKAEVAIEVKISSHVDRSDLKGLIAFVEEHHPKAAYVVSLDPNPRKMQITADYAIHILPWKVFLERLWKGKIIAQ